MTEIYRNTSQSVYLDIHGAEADSQPTATLRRYGVDPIPLSVLGPTTPQSGVQRWETNVGLANTQYDGPISIEWAFQINGSAASKVDFLDVVTPYVTPDDARDELEIPPGITDDQIVKVERRVRRIINRVCGQSFGLQPKSVLVRGSGDRVLQLPERLHEITTFNRHGYGWPLTGYEVRTDGWVLYRVWPNADDYDEIITSVGPIVNPYSINTLLFEKNVEWVIEGLWGYERVPTEIYEATLILMEMQLCADSIYRDRYISTFRTADDNIGFNAGAYGGTGNVTADQLLGEYVRPRWALI